MKPRTREIFRIALPAVAGYLGIMLYDVIDIFWIAKLGTEAVAGAATAGYLMWMVEALMGLTGIGVSTLVAQAIGAKRPERGIEAFQEAVLVSVLMSAVIVAVLGPLAPWILRLLGLTEAARAQGAAYFGTLVYGLPCLQAVILLNGVFNAHGDTRTDTIIMSVSLAINATLDPFFMFGWSFFPELGVRGAAVASIIGWTTGASLRLVVLSRRGWIGSWRDLPRLRFRHVRRLFGIGAPTSFVHLIWTFSYPLLTMIITAFGMAPLAGMTLAHRFEGFAYFTALGFSVAMGALVGQRIGAGDRVEAEQVVREGRRLISTILVPATVVFVLGAGPLIGLLSDDAEAVGHGADYLRAVGILTIFLGWEMCYEGAFNGLGRTRPYMLISVPLTLGRYPVALLLTGPCSLGVDAVWWTIAGSTLLKGVILSVVFHRSIGRV